MLIAVLAIAAVLIVLCVIFSVVAARFVDKRWPANEPLTPSEVLWAESGSHVSKHFPGLDPTIARDLAPYITTRKVTPGTVIVEAGDLPTHFVLLKSGAAEVLGPQGSTSVKAGATFGHDNIIRRLPHGATVTATAPSEIVSLGAQDYLAALALGMSDDNDDYVVNVLGGYLDPDGLTADGLRREQPAANGSTLAPPRPVVRGWADATHVVVDDQLPGFILPAGDQPTRTLAAGTAVSRIESLPGWHHVRTEDGWHGWVVDSGLRGTS